MKCPDCGLVDLESWYTKRGGKWHRVCACYLCKYRAIYAPGEDPERRARPARPSDERPREDHPARS